MSCYINDGLWIKNIVILNAKGIDYRSILWGISKNDAVDRLNNFVLEDKGVYKTPFKVIKESVFGGTYFRDLYSSVNGKWYRK